MISENLSSRDGIEIALSNLRCVMPNWSEILKEITESKRIDSLDFVRRKYLEIAHIATNRNIIAYYSSFLQKSNIAQIEINDNDMNGFMTVIHKMDRAKGLDLMLHTPGGNIAATESIVEYLKTMFNGDIRVIVPQIAMSAGTMIACASKEIVMGKQSSLGPIDPQFGNISAPEVLEEIKAATKEIRENPSTIPLWQVRIGKYHPTFIAECNHAVNWSKEMVTKWLCECMFRDENDKEQKSKEVVDYLSSHSGTKSHQRHIGIDECRSIGLKVSQLENDHGFQDNILSIHHAYMCTFAQSAAVKIIENHGGEAYIQQQLPTPLMPSPIQIEKRG